MAVTNKTAKIEMILDVAIKILEAEGDYGVSMRKVATNAEMSLSNLQYYFKNKNELLKAMADRYFKQCLDDLDADVYINNQAELKDLTSHLLSHVYDVSEMCKIFREYWAISTRNEAIDEYLIDYYRSMAELMKTKLRPLAKNEQYLSQAISFLIPFVEGYSVTAKSMPVGLESMSEKLSDILLRSLTDQ